MANKVIEHRGTITTIQDGVITVNIQVESACASCEAQGTCMSNDSKSRSIEVRKASGNYTVGQLVTIIGEQKDGLQAVFLAYFLPFLLILASLILTTKYINNEVTAGLISLGVLFPYYGLLWLLRNRISKSFQFELRN